MEERWAKLEEIVRRVVREELASLKKKPKVDFVNGRWVGIGEEEMNAWEAAFPAVDVGVELKKAAAWIVSNPNLAPKSHYARFINNWLAKGQNQAALRSIPFQHPKTTDVPSRRCAYCEKKATGKVGAIDCCDAHTLDAMDQKPRAA